MEDLKKIQRNSTFEKLGYDERNYLPTSLRDILKATPDAQGYEDYFFMRLFPIADRIPLYNNFLANQWASGYVPMLHYRSLNSKTCPSISKKLVSKIIGNFKIEGEQEADVETITSQIVDLTNKVTAAEAHCLDRGEAVITTNLIGDKDPVTKELTNKKIVLNVYPLARYILKKEADGEIYDAVLFKELFKEDNTNFINYLLCEHRFYKLKDGLKTPYKEFIVTQNTWTQNDGFWTENIKTSKLDKKDLPKFIVAKLGDIEINKPVAIPQLGVYRLKNSAINKLAPYSDMGESQFIDASGWMMAVESAMTYREMDKYIGRGRALVPQMKLSNGLTIDPHDDMPKASALDYSFMTPYEGAVGSLDSKPPVQAIQFSIRTDEWNMSYSFAEAKVCVRCGISVLDYDPTLMGGAVRTATEIDYMTDITANTVKEKRALIQDTLNEMLNDISTLLGYEAQVFVKFDPTTIVNALQNSSMVLQQYGSGLISLETALKALHPEWNNAELEAEKTKISQERDNAAAVGEFNSTFGVGA